nr:MAG: pentaxin family [Bacteriophage sp.]
MGTISDKLMRIINTKEDIRQALISKGYDVPTSIPFKEYAKMILDLPCKVDSFPDIEGIVARYSASGLTNEQMAANPVWVDKTGNGHDLQLKNFAWKGMSGVGGYVADIDEWGTNSTAAYFERNSIKITATFKENVSLGLLYHNIKLRQSCVLKVTGIPEGCDAFLDDRLGNRFYMSEDGVYEIIPSNFLAEALYFSIEKYPERWYGSKLTIEQLPLYPGALVFDGVDDYGVCDNFPILTKEKGYTVVALRQYLVEKSTAYLTANGDSISNTSFIFEGNNYKDTWNFGKVTTIQASRILATQTSKQYDGVKLNIGTNTEGSNLLQVGKWSKSYSNVAIWELVFLDHDATEEELTKIKDYFVKTYPWLFPDQAWTVVGKTNEDEDRATIANITGNGNNLVLSNSGFAEGSGYGLYAENYAGGRWVQSTDRADLTWTSYSVNITSVKVASTQLYYQSYPEQPSFIVPSYKIKVYGLKDGQTLSYRQATSEGQQLYKISEDGTYTLPSFPFKANGDWYGFTLNKVQESCDITIEQIPEYEGYLVTDGVDDKITSSTFEMGNDWTVIGDWELINTGKNDNAGIVKFDSIVIYNYNPILINIKNGRNNLIPDQNTVNAICSDGRIYSKDWKESIYNEETESTSKNFLTIGYSGNVYTKIAFKNLAIYPTVLSREDCIKAYNYLQTLKAK